jgi:hypothetical protein
MLSHWRRIAAPIIANVLSDNAGKPTAEVRAALRAAYPFGPRRYHPYRIWLDEIAVQTGKRRPGPKPRQVPGRSPLPPDERQREMFSNDAVSQPLFGD